MNPFLQPSTRPFGAIPFDIIKPEHFIPALKEGIEQARENIKKIKSNPQTANFENTILALETSSEMLDLASGTYYVLFGAEAPKELQALAGEVAKIQTEFASDVSLDIELFTRVKQAYENIKNENLSNEQKRLAEKLYKSFTRNGALLSKDDKILLRKIDQELAALTPRFSENVLAATNDYLLFIDEERRLVGLPETAKEAAKELAEQKGQTNKWAFSLQAPSFIPAMQYLEDANLRKELYMAYSKKNFKDKWDNSEIVKKIVSLRDQRAKLLGAKNHADYVLQERMAKSADRVYDFLNKILKHSKPAALVEIDELRKLKKRDGNNDPLMPWDVRFYEERLKKEKFNFDDEELRPYFELQSVYKGAFSLVERLYDIEFKKHTDLPVYHPDVEVYEVIEKSNGSHIGLLYMDFFPRDTKRGGAWMTELIGQGLYKGKITRPHIGIVMNFTKPTKTKPSLLNYEEVSTFFHEFGHALHGLLSKCTYRSVAGTNVYWDFVELPSQFMENWVLEKEVLDLFAKHYLTGEKLPNDLFERVKASNKFMSGYYSMRQLTFGLLDMAWHTTNPNDIADIDTFETEAIRETQILDRVHGTNMSTAFAHIFAGGYSAGYYSYKWAEVLDADAFSYFKETGLFNKDTAKKFKENILELGGSEHPMELYKKFRGREPDPNALLKRDGLIRGDER